MVSQSPPPKRIKLESSPELEIVDPADAAALPDDENNEVDGEHCSICLQPLSDRTVLPACSHEFCFDCILIWTEQSRKCPLCSGQVGDYLIHNIRSKYDYQKHYLPPLRAASPSAAPLARAQAAQRRRARREVEWGRSVRRERERERRAADELERAIEKRRWVYRHHLYAKHVASNAYTRYRPFPTPQQFAANTDLISRATVFIRRELRVWDALDVEFLTTFTISLMKSLDIRSEPAVKLLAEFLDMDSDGLKTNAEHFAHELYSYLRSPYRDLAVYDTTVQYDAPADLSPPRHHERSRRWASESPSPPPSRSPSPGLSRVRSGAGTRRPSRSPSPAERRGPEPSSASRRRTPTRSRSRSSSRWRDRDPQPDAAVPRTRDAKGKGRAADGGRGREARTYTRTQRGGVADPADGRRSAGAAGTAAHSTSGAAASAGQSPGAEGGGGQDAPGSVAGVEGAGGDGATHVVEQDAVQTGQVPAPPGKEERPKVSRNTWQSLNSYLAGSVGEGHKGHRPASRLQPEANSGRESAQLTIRGAARGQGDSPKNKPTDEPVDGRPRPSLLSRLGTGERLDKTATGTPAAQALTPEPADADAAQDNMPAREVMARTRARLAKLKEELARSGTSADATAPRPAPAPPFPQPTPINAGPAAPPPRGALALLPMAVATAAESPPPPAADSSSIVPATASALRARLRARLARERSAHMQHHEAPRHGDARTPPSPPRGPAAGECALDPPAAAAARRDAEMREARLRQQARLRVGAAHDNRALEATSSSSGAGQCGGELQTREEALRARLKRGR